MTSPASLQLHQRVLFGRVLFGRVLFGLLVLFLLGWFALPSTAQLANQPHDLLFWLGLLPAFLVLRLPQLWRVPRREPVVALAAAAIAWQVLSIGWSRPPLELSVWRGLLDGLSTFVFVVASVDLLDEHRAATLERWLAGAGGVLAFLSLGRYALGHRYFGGRLGHAFNFEHPNLLGHSLGFAAVLCLRLTLDGSRPRRDRVVWGVAGLLCTAAVVLTRGRTPGLALLVAVLVVLLVQQRRRLALAVAASLLVLLGGLALARPELVGSYLQRGDAGRDVIWTTLIARTADQPLWGHGLLASDDVAFPVGSGDFPSGAVIVHAHSLLVGTYFRGGAVGLGLLVVLVGGAVAASVRAVRAGGVGRSFPLLVFGTICLIPDGHRLVSNPHLSSWLLLWLPIALAVREARARGVARVEAVVSEAAMPGVPIPAPVQPTPEAGDRAMALLAAGPPRWFLLTVGFLLLAQRLAHFGPELDEPHLWRQSDTAHYAQDLFERGFDLLHPAVCWMGPHRTLVLEFPLPQAVMALGYHIFGEDHRVARAVTFGFFLVAAWCLHGLVREILGRGVASWTLLAYLGMPLALFYSRAVHIDYPALAFAHAMAWCWVRAALRGSRRWLLLGVALAIPAVLIKAPYAATVLLPIVVVGLRSPHWRRLLPVMPALVVPVLVFVAWQRHSLAVNATAPDWSFIPTYRRFVDNAHWYYGEWRQRLDLERWATVAGRLTFEGVGLLGLIPTCAGGCLVLAQRRLWPVAAWLAGLGFYVLVFFNLNVVHNYYQIPLLAPLAICLVVGLAWVASVLTRSTETASRLVMGLVVACAGLGVMHAERHYYVVPAPYLEVAALVREHTPEDALVVVTFRELDPRAPHILYPAHRDGWSIPERDLTPDLLERLRQEGATHLAIAWTASPSDPALVAYVGELRVLAQGQVEGSRVGVYQLAPSNAQNPEVSGRR